MTQLDFYLKFSEKSILKDFSKFSAEEQLIVFRFYKQNQIIFHLLKLDVKINKKIQIKFLLSNFDIPILQKEIKKNQKILNLFQENQKDFLTIVNELKIDFKNKQKFLYFFLDVIVLSNDSLQSIFDFIKNILEKRNFEHLIYLLKIKNKIETKTNFLLLNNQTFFDIFFNLCTSQCNYYGVDNKIFSQIKKMLNKQDLNIINNSTLKNINTFFNDNKSPSQQSNIFIILNCIYFNPIEQNIYKKEILSKISKVLTLNDTFSYSHYLFYLYEKIFKLIDFSDKRLFNEKHFNFFLQLVNLYKTQQISAYILKYLSKINMKIIGLHWIRHNKLKMITFCLITNKTNLLEELIIKKVITEKQIIQELFLFTPNMLNLTKWIDTLLNVLKNSKCAVDLIIELINKEQFKNWISFSNPLLSELLIFIFKKIIKNNSEHHHIAKILICNNWKAHQEIFLKYNTSDIFFNFIPEDFNWQQKIDITFFPEKHHLKNKKKYQLLELWEVFLLTYYQDEKSIEFIWNIILKMNLFTIAEKYYNIYNEKNISLIKEIYFKHHLLKTNKDNKIVI